VKLLTNLTTLKINGGDTLHQFQAVRLSVDPLIQAEVGRNIPLQREASRASISHNTLHPPIATGRLLRIRAIRLPQRPGAAPPNAGHPPRTPITPQIKGTTQNAANSQIRITPPRAQNHSLVFITLKYISRASKFKAIKTSFN
jgi:hypothetical protein